MTNKNHSISIVIPAYNEEESIVWVLKDTLKTLPKYFKDFEIIVLDDGSTDKTAKITDRFAAISRNLRAIHQPNGGFSKAMLAGIKAAKKEFVAYMPADGQFLVEDMRHCFEVMESNDMVLGYRGGRPDYTTKRMIFSFGYLLLLTLLFNIKFMDVGWVVIWRTQKVKRLKLTATGGIFILTETVVRFQKAGHKIAEAPSYYHVRKAGEVKNAKMKVIWSTLLSALKLKWELLLTNTQK